MSLTYVTPAEQVGTCPGCGMALYRLADPDGLFRLACDGEQYEGCDYGALATAAARAEEAAAEVARQSAVHEAEKLQEVARAHPAYWRVQRLPTAWGVYADGDTDGDTADLAAWALNCPSPYQSHEALIDAAGTSVRCRLDGCPGPEEIRRALGAPDVAEFLMDDDDESLAEDEIIPNVLLRSDRLILTGSEGMGKTTLCRQLAYQVASGVHPFTLEAITARRVLYIDLEVGPQYTRQEFRKMRASSGVEPEPGKLIIVSRPEGIDLSTAADQRWFRDQAAGVDLIVFGALYKACAADLADEGAARALTAFLDKIRTGAALLIEAHQPHASGNAGRTLRPYGSSLFLRWPEFGLHIGGSRALVNVRHWRASRCPEREWPEQLVSGRTWPWTVPADNRKPWEKAGMSKTSYYRKRGEGVPDES